MKAKVEAETPVKTADSRLVQRCVPCKDTLAARQQDSMYGKNMRVRCRGMGWDIDENHP